MLQLAPMLTFLPMLTEEDMPPGIEWKVWMVVWSPMEEKWPTLIGFISALRVAPYQTVEYFERNTSPTRQAFGAIQASLVVGIWSYRGSTYLCLDSSAL